MAKQYFTLLERDGVEGLWTMQFGDYDRETVEIEKDDMRGAAKLDGRKGVMFRIIATRGARQSLVVAAVATINAGLMVRA